MTLCDSCDQDQCATAKQKPGESKEAYRDRQKLESRLYRVKRKIVILSGKGGVGKSTIAVNLAAGLKAMGLKWAYPFGALFPSIPMWPQPEIRDRQRLNWMRRQQRRDTCEGQ